MNRNDFFSKTGSVFFLAGCISFFMDTQVWAESSKPTDSEIAAIVEAANNSEITEGKYAESHSKNSEVKKFGKDMVTGHTALNQGVKAVLSKLTLIADENETSRKLKNDSQSELAKLKKLSGQEFDQEYAKNAVSAHESVLEALDKVLIPDATNPELKAFLVKARPQVAAHLAHAKKLEASLN